MTTTDAIVISEHHPTAWYAEMGAPEKRTFWAATARAHAADHHRVVCRLIGVFAAIAYGVMIAAALLLPETKGRELTSEAA